MDNPKVFISYSWHPKENQQKVKQLAEQLTADGVHVLIDIWDLQDGHDKNAYMERMVNDPSVQKVLLICNKEYAEKANSREGGVGIESTIISEEIYSNIEQTKFIPVIFEKDQNNKAYTPTFVKSRVFIDMSNDDVYPEGYDKLLRDIYDKPLYERPPLGTMPSYLKAESPVFLKTTHKVDSIKRALFTGAENVELLVRDYIDTYIELIPDFIIEKTEFTEKNHIEKIEEGIRQMEPLKNDFIDFLQVMAKTKYLTGDLLIDFFERLLQKYEDNEINLIPGQYLDELIFDHFRFFNYDLVLSVVAVLVEYREFSVLHDILKTRYCIVSEIRLGGHIEEVSFVRFNKYNYTLEQYKQEAEQTHRVSIIADMIHRKANKIRPNNLVKTDLLLYYLSLIYKRGNGFYESYWYPYLSIYNRTTQILPRMASLRYFDRAKVLFECQTVGQFKQLISSVEMPPNVHDIYHDIPTIKSGLGYDIVGTYD